MSRDEAHNGKRKAEPPDNPARVSPGKQVVLYSWSRLSHQVIREEDTGTSRAESREELTVTDPPGSPAKAGPGKQVALSSWSRPNRQLFREE